MMKMKWFSASILFALIFAGCANNPPPAPTPPPPAKVGVEVHARDVTRAPGLVTLEQEVGAVVVIFEEDESRYPWCMTWLGEHSQESDMAFYSTNPYDQPVGPGITIGLPKSFRAS